jgi:hypothetical protein
VIAIKIIKWQSALASRLNARINHFPGRAKMSAICFLRSFNCGLGLLPYCPVRQNGNDQIAGSNYQPTHIGLPSGRPQPTDSLTIKK